MAEPFARLSGVTLRYGKKVVLDGLDLDIVRGAITCVVGLSGAGKSTVLRLINGLRKPQAGRVIVEGQDVALLDRRALLALRCRIGFSFQFAALFDSLSIGDNVAFPLREHTGLDAASIAAKVAATLAEVGLGGVEERFPVELSGGMVKRAGFARAVVTDPACILYDEPTTGLDPIVTRKLTELIVTLRKRTDGTAVVVSHDLTSVYEMADYVALLYGGRVAEYGTVKAIRSSTNPIVRQFLAGSTTGPIVV